MAVSIHKIKKWSRMILGKSISHVNQGVGKVYSKFEIKGYYNDLTEKVLKRDLADNDIPISDVDTGEKIYFSIEIFQYGLGAYDLFLINSDISMLNKAITSANWALMNQNKDGSWSTFAYENPNFPFSSMAQAEGVSLLLRVYIETKDRRYLDSAKKALDFMIKPIEEGGTTLYKDNGIYFFECINEPLILNGWIFSIWGLYDYCIFTSDTEYLIILNNALETLRNNIERFDIKYWSDYELGGKRISSPFYHKLHINQLKVLFKLTSDEQYRFFYEKWEKYQKNFLYKTIAFLVKVFQKIKE